MNKKNAYDITGFSDELKKKLENLTDEIKILSGGISGDTLMEPVPEHNRAACEVVYKNENNASIVLGRDRTGDKDSGYGGRGDTQCGSIDLVVGRYGEESGKPVDPNFTRDAARIYISQKCDVDSAFGIVNGKYGESKTKSTVAIKADGIRIISRENTKIIAGIDEYNSQGANRRGAYGVEIIANNDDSELQSIPKGENLEAALKDIIAHIDDLAGMIETIARNQVIVNSVLMAHTHPFIASPSVELIAPILASNADIATNVYSGVIKHKINSAFLKTNYLLRMGYKYINSKFNKVN